MPRPPQPSRRQLFVTAGALALAPITSTTVGARSPARAIDFTADAPTETSDADSESPADCEADDDPHVTLFVAVVDRIVDGEHVVLLLEDGDELVDQHVEPVDSFERIAERDVLFVALEGETLLGYRHLEERPRIR